MYWYADPFWCFQKRRQALEEKRFRLQQEELRLHFEAKMVKTTADEAVYAIMATASLPKLKPIKLEKGIQVQDPPVTSPHAKTTIRGEMHHPGQGVSVDSVTYAVYWQRESEKGNNWFAAATDCPSVSAE